MGLGGDDQRHRSDRVTELHGPNHWREIQAYLGPGQREHVCTLSIVADSFHLPGQGDQKLMTPPMGMRPSSRCSHDLVYIVEALRYEWNALTFDRSQAPAGV